ncbi:uncharacterized protein LOC142874877 [Microcebus murinus]|uniref:uncharacterized protein LOC142874877 n=1 Tax=Microcebus murinus TaxID=30608 RepID=UPI003F6C6D33
MTFDKPLEIPRRRHAPARHAPDRTGFLQRPPARRSSHALSQRLARFRRAAGTEAQAELSPAPTHAGPCRPGPVPTLAAGSGTTPSPERSRPAGTYLRPLVTREEPQMEAAQPPVLPPRGRNGTRWAPRQNGLAAPSVPRPAPPRPPGSASAARFAFVPPPCRASPQRW